MDFCSDCGLSYYGGIFIGATVTFALCWMGLRCARRSRVTFAAPRVYAAFAVVLFSLAVVTAYAPLVGF